MVILPAWSPGVRTRGLTLLPLLVFVSLDKTPNGKPWWCLVIWQTKRWSFKITKQIITKRSLSHLWIFYAAIQKYEMLNQITTPNYLLSHQPAMNVNIEKYMKNKAKVKTPCSLWSSYNMAHGCLLIHQTHMLYSYTSCSLLSYNMGVWKVYWIQHVCLVYNQKTPMGHVITRPQTHMVYSNTSCSLLSYNMGVFLYTPDIHSVFKHLMLTVELWHVCNCIAPTHMVY